MKRLALIPFAALAACTTSTLPPAEVIRYHLPAGPERGPVAVEQVTPGLSSQPYAAAVGDQLQRNGYVGTAPGVASPLIASVEVHQRATSYRRPSPLSIGLGGGGYSGGYRGGTAVGGGVSFPVGGGVGTLVDTELSVLIKRRADGNTVWEGHAHAISDPRKPNGVDAAIASRLAAALFQGFPGESGRTISVK